MKKLILSIATLATIFTSCSSSDDSEGGTNPVVTGEITGNVTANKTYIKGNYTLNGTVKVRPGITLTFEAGSIITSDVSNGVDALVVENGGKLIMNGTAAEPIVCTHTTKVPGSWGGIIIYGDAPIVGAASVTSATAEDGLKNDAGVAYTYGGSNPTHNGGTLKYVRVEYAGKKIGDGNSEMNGFSFYSVGSGTILENLVSYKGADDGFEFYGGTVSATNLISYGNYDDSFDWQDGWRGQNNSNWYAYQTGTANFGMEVEAKSVNNAFWPVISNITLKRASGTLTENASVEYDAIQFKKQGNGDFSNILITGYSDANATAVRIQDAATNNDQVTGSKIKLTNVKIEGSTSQFAAISGVTPVFPTGYYTLSTTTMGANLNSGAWSVAEGINLLQ